MHLRAPLSEPVILTLEHALNREKCCSDRMRASFAFVRREFCCSQASLSHLCVGFACVCLGARYTKSGSSRLLSSLCPIRKVRFSVSAVK